jgi:hypothetical protein
MKAEQNQSGSWAFDLAKMSLASFALLGLAGCQQQSANERVQSRPIVEPEQILANPSAWIGKQVTIYGSPKFVEDKSSLRFSSPHTYLELDIRYVIALGKEANGQSVLNVDKWGSYDVCGDKISIKNPTGPYYLNEGTTIVSGTIKKYDKKDGIYLHLDTALVREPMSSK